MPAPIDLNTTAHRQARATALEALPSPASGWITPALFDHHQRDYSASRHDLRKAPVPDNPWLHQALRIAGERRETRGWSQDVHGRVRRGLVVLLTGHVQGDALHTSQHHETLTRRTGSARLATEILQEMGILIDDRPSALDTWITTQLALLGTDFAAQANRWSADQRHGGARSLPRSQATVVIQLARVVPALKQWSARHDHLREVTRDDVLDHLAPLDARPRQETLVALRSLFRWARKNGVVFLNPCHRIPVRTLPDSVVQPLDQQEITAAVDAAGTRAHRLAVAFAALYAARPGQIRAIRLDDVDLPNRTLAIAERTHRLDELTFGLLRDWLDFRGARWPNTANPHLLINQMTAVRLTPASHAWTTRPLRGLTATLERLRIDRVLEEALARGPDPLHLTKVFGLSPRTAIKYANSARQLLESPVETQDPGVHTNPSAESTQGFDRHFGSR